MLSWMQKKRRGDNYEKEVVDMETENGYFAYIGNQKIICFSKSGQSKS